MAVREVVLGKRSFPNEEVARLSKSIYRYQRFSENYELSTDPTSISSGYLNPFEGAVPL
ncbi:hypothetical protein Elgi_56500 [Paenibacillus elgii]|nr:hypothetical protein Elgi_56500 [Paenibacillus elgii]